MLFRGKHRCSCAAHSLAWLPRLSRLKSRLANQMLAGMPLCQPLMVAASLSGKGQRFAVKQTRGFLITVCHSTQEQPIETKRHALCQSLPSK